MACKSQTDQSYLDQSYLDQSYLDQSYLEPLDRPVDHATLATRIFLLALSGAQDLPVALIFYFIKTQCICSTRRCLVSYRFDVALLSMKKIIDRIETNTIITVRQSRPDWSFFFFCEGSLSVLRCSCHAREPKLCAINTETSNPSDTQTEIEQCVFSFLYYSSTGI